MPESIEIIVANAQAKAQNYPQYAYLLHQAGILHYRVDVATHLITYHGSEEQQWIVQAEIVIPEAQRTPNGFDEAGIKQAIQANQKGESDYHMFIQQIWMAGVTHYDADLQERVVTYRGATDEAYAEYFPLIVVD